MSEVELFRERVKELKAKVKALKAEVKALKANLAAALTDAQRLRERIELADEIEGKLAAHQDFEIVSAGEHLRAGV